MLELKIGVLFYFKPADHTCPSKKVQKHKNEDAELQRLLSYKDYDNSDEMEEIEFYSWGLLYFSSGHLRSSLCAMYQQLIRIQNCELSTSLCQ